jgi:hypothetical protein
MPIAIPPGIDDQKERKAQAKRAVSAARSNKAFFLLR